MAVPEKYDKLIIALRTAFVNEYSLDKEQSSYNDLLDALRLSLRGFRISQSDRVKLDLFEVQKINKMD